MSNISLICDINKPEVMLEMNKNNIYLLTNIGIKSFDTEDEIGLQINNLQNITYKFNVNDVFVFRTFDNKKILVYLIMENKLYIFNSKKLIYNIMIYIDNYMVVLFENKELEIINYKTFKYVKFIRNTILLEDYFSLCLKSIQDDLLKDTIIVKNNIKPILLPKSKVNTDFEPKIEKIQIDDKYDQIICERIWSVFTLQKFPCYNFSIINNNQREFQYLVNINTNKVLFKNIVELIHFLNTEFYNHLKICSFLI